MSTHFSINSINYDCLQSFFDSPDEETLEEFYEVCLDEFMDNFVPDGDEEKMRELVDDIINKGLPTELVRGDDSDDEGARCCLFYLLEEIDIFEVEPEFDPEPPSVDVSIEFINAVIQTVNAPVLSTLKNCPLEAVKIFTPDEAREISAEIKKAFTTGEMDYYRQDDLMDSLVNPFHRVAEKKKGLFIWVG